MVRFELRRAETVCSLAITYQHDLARPKLDEAAAAKRLHMDKNIGSSGPRVESQNRAVD